MNRKTFLSVIVLVLAIPFAFCSCREDEESEYVSEIGTWNLYDVEYYYDGKKLDYKDFKIGLWTSPESQDYFVCVSKGGFTFNDGGKGILFGMGEFQDTEIAFSYSRNGNKLSIDFEASLAVQPAFEIAKEKLKMRYTLPMELYGWSKCIEGEDLNINGSDGKATHKMEIVDIYTRK